MTVVLLSSLKIGQILLAIFRSAPDAPVEDAHDCHRSVERRNGRTECEIIVRLDKLDVAFT